MSALDFEALAFGPGLAPAGTRGTLALQESAGGTVLELRVGDVVRRVAPAEARLREVGFGRPGVELAWTDAGEDWIAHVLDPDAAQRLIAHRAIAGSTAALSLVAARRRRGTGRALGWSALAFIVLLPVLLLLVFWWQSDRIAEWVADRIPIETERALGRSSFEGLRGGLKLQDSGAAYEAVQTIGARLAAGSKYSYEFHVAQDPAINAFALPGGIVVVNTGLIAATKRPEELAGVLAHEVQHVEQRHSLEALAKELGLRAVWALVTGDVGGTLAGEAALQLGSMSFSRDAEREADAKGFALLVERGIDPAGMPVFFETMRAQAQGEPPALLSTHPASEARAKALAAEVRALGARRFEPLSIGKWPPE